MKCYRFKHIPTGMYYIPSRTVRFRLKNPSNPKEIIWVLVKSNLSKKGKIYPTMPSWRYIQGGIYDHLSVKEGLLNGSIRVSSEFYYTTSMSRPFIQLEWELEEL